MCLHLFLVLHKWMNANACRLFVQSSYIHLFCGPIWISRTSMKLRCSLDIHNLSKSKKRKKALSSNSSQLPILIKLFFYLSPPSISLWIFYSFISLLAMIFPTGRSLVMPWKISVWFCIRNGFKNMLTAPCFP